jgi:hypothetical protein
MIDHIVYAVPRRLAEAVAWFAGLTGAQPARGVTGVRPQNGSGRAGPEFLGAPTSATDSWSGEADLPEERPVVPEQVLLNDPAE